MEIELSMKLITIVVIDDHPIFRQGVIDSFSLEPDIVVVGEADNGEDGIELIKTSRPQVAVVDVNLPGLNGQQVTRRIAEEKLSTRVILLTAYDDADQKLHAMRAGAAAYCVKDVKPEYLIKVIRDVARGKYVIDEEVFDVLDLDRWVTPQTFEALRPYSDPGQPYQPLSKREMEVLTLVTQGMSNKEIAGNLNISHQTVKNHVTSILRKLGVEDRTQAALYALRLGWVRLQQGDDPQE